MSETNSLCLLLLVVRTNLYLGVLFPYVSHVSWTNERSIERTENEMNHQPPLTPSSPPSSWVCGVFCHGVVLCGSLLMCAATCWSGNAESTQNKRGAECRGRQRRSPDLPRRRRPASTMYTRLYRNSHIYLACSTILSLRPHQTEIARPPSSNPIQSNPIEQNCHPPPSFCII